ncbi:MAG: SAM-dependent methyltransferase [Verrucomicrobia bacterium CG22_combo_CG10-13_8_21_14_all_43_17]|nr:MAG: SAM-dependent methyltransferase [Verrucomicrobia bacterium CG22_combo_CG10-13_8_21_14_all_43_17]
MEPKNFNPLPFPYHHELELEITSLTNLGIGLGRLDNWVIMVPFALPGEIVKVKVFRNHKNYSEADLVEVLRPSPHRIPAPCPLFGTCGGCQYQNLAYGEQLRWKTQHVKELLLKLAGIECDVNLTHGSSKEYHYRSKLTPHYPKPMDGKPFPIGFLHQGKRNHIVDVPQCPIATEEINTKLTKSRAKLQQKAAEGAFRKGGTLLLRHTLEGVTSDNNKEVSEQVGDYKFDFLAGDFFQNNPFIITEFVDYILKEAHAPNINYLIDAYCGVGLFAISGSKIFQECLGIEVNESATNWARHNAKINNADNCSFVLGQAEGIFEHVKVSPAETAVIIDPPRKGCDIAFLDQLTQYAPNRIVYVSCDPATQARDLQHLLAHNYKITAVQPFDLFPQTRHIENVVSLSSTQ